jgi:hypothetical protein
MNAVCCVGRERTVRPGAAGAGEPLALPCVSEPPAAGPARQRAPRPHQRTTHPPRSPISALTAHSISLRGPQQDPPAGADGALDFKMARTHKWRCLERAALPVPGDGDAEAEGAPLGGDKPGSKARQRVTVTEVEELKALLSLAPILAVAALFVLFRRGRRNFCGLRFGGVWFGGPPPRRRRGRRGCWASPFPWRPACSRRGGPCRPSTALFYCAPPPSPHPKRSFAPTAFLPPSKHRAPPRDPVNSLLPLTGDTMDRRLPGGRRLPAATMSFGAQARHGAGQTHPGLPTPPLAALVRAKTRTANEPTIVPEKSAHKPPKHPQTAKSARKPAGPARPACSSAWWRTTASSPHGSGAGGGPSPSCSASVRRGAGLRRPPRLAGKRGPHLAKPAGRAALPLGARLRRGRQGGFGWAFGCLRVRGAPPGRLTGHAPRFRATPGPGAAAWPPTPGPPPARLPPCRRRHMD